MGPLVLETPIWVISSVCQKGHLLEAARSCPSLAPAEPSQKESKPVPAEARTRAKRRSLDNNPNPGDPNSREHIIYFRPQSTYDMQIFDP